MPYKCIYYWQDDNKKVRKSVGIELYQDEKLALARKNIKLLNRI